MAPVRTYSNWNTRSSENKEQIEPYRHYYFICEGSNTEKWYFQKLIDTRKELSIHSRIDIVYLEKTDEHQHLSNPLQLITFADEQKINKAISFDANFDKMIVIFDADVFENQLKNYDEIIRTGLKKNILGVTNPSFELFLLLHYENSVDEIILPNESRIIQNQWVGTGKSKKRCIEDLFRKKAKMRPKTNNAIGSLASQIFTAIDQEKKINNNINSCKGIITSNIGQIIKKIIDEQSNS